MDGARAAARATPATFPAAALGRTRQSSAISRFQGSVRGVVWPGREFVARLIHRSGLCRAAEAAAASSAAKAGLREGGSPAHTHSGVAGVDPGHQLGRELGGTLGNY